MYLVSWSLDADFAGGLVSIEEMRASTRRTTILVVSTCDNVAHAFEGTPREAWEILLDPAHGRFIDACFAGQSFS
jgi:hypothetical protein